MNTLGFVFRSVPHGTAAGREGQDAILAASAYSEDIAVFFHGDGVFQILKGQQPGQVLSREYGAAFKLFELYDIEQVYVCAASLRERGIEPAQLLIEAEVCESVRFRDVLHGCQRVLTF